MHVPAKLAKTLSGNGFAEVYKWVNDTGRVHYRDEPSATQKFKRLAGENITRYDTVTFKNVLESSGATKHSSRSTNGKVFIYSSAWCGYCKQARKYFKSKGIAFIEYDIEKNVRTKQDYDALGGKGVPVILVGRKRMNGFSRQGFDRIYK